MRATDMREAMARLVATIADAPPQCASRPELGQALARFARTERRRAALGHLADARSRREQIEIMLLYLDDLSELNASEPDGSVYMDFAFLFDDIADIARKGACAMRGLSAATQAEAT